PWVYRSDLANADASPSASLVHVTDSRGKFIASALSSSSSQIALRVISWDVVEDAELPQLIGQRIAQASRHRERFVSDTEAYRLAFSEADQLPGLIIDRYKNVFSLQALTQAMDREDLRATVLQALRSEFGNDISVFERVDARIR